MSDVSLAPVPLTRRLRNPALLLVPAVLFLGLIYLLPLIDLFRVSMSGPTWSTHFERVFSVPLYVDSLVRTMQIAFTVAVMIQRPQNGFASQ